MYNECDVSVPWHPLPPQSGAALYQGYWYTELERTIRLICGAEVLANVKQSLWIPEIALLPFRAAVVTTSIVCGCLEMSQDTHSCRKSSSKTEKSRQIPQESLWFQIRALGTITGTDKYMVCRLD
jgi:hypothetical protein